MENVEKLVSSNGYTQWVKDPIERGMNLDDGYFDKSEHERNGRSIKDYFKAIKDAYNFIDRIARG